MDGSTGVAADIQGRLGRTTRTDPVAAPPTLVRSKETTRWPPRTSPATNGAPSATIELFNERTFRTNGMSRTAPSALETRTVALAEASDESSAAASKFRAKAPSGPTAPPASLLI